jgi:hypothetical protein
MSAPNDVALGGVAAPERHLLAGPAVAIVDKRASDIARWSSSRAAARSLSAMRR